jgi:hypothetical protein
MSYTPNLNDPRVRARCKTALGFAIGTMSDSKPHGWSTLYINQYFGQFQTPLARYLRRQLLICTNNHYSMSQGICKQYVLNRAGADNLKQALAGQALPNPQQHQNNSQPIPEILYDRALVTAWCQREFAKDLKSLDFNYKDQSNRLWHPLQNVRREFKQPVLAQAGLTFQYDIECAAPKLIRQHAFECDNTIGWLEHIDTYINNKNSVRERLALQSETDIQKVKVLINALFCGAKLGNNNQFALSQLLDNDPARIAWFKQGAFIIGLQQDIRRCWTAIGQTLPATYITDKNGNRRKRPLNSRVKWAIYFQEERAVLNAVRTYLKKHNIQYFLEHDGWVTNQPIDVRALRTHIETRTRRDVTIQEEVLK